MRPRARRQTAPAERGRLRSGAVPFATDEASGDTRAGMTAAGVPRSARFEVGDVFEFDIGRI